MRAPITYLVYKSVPLEHLYHKCGRWNCRKRRSPSRSYCLHHRLIHRAFPKERTLFEQLPGRLALNREHVRTAALFRLAAKCRR